MEVGIIGGGALGLSAAYELTRRGHKPVVYERAPFLGGQASTFDVGGGRLERGYHHLFRSDTSIVELIEELGLGDKLAWIESSVGFYSQGEIHPFTTPLDLLRFKPLNPFQRLRLGLVTLFLQRKKYWPREYEHVTARDWLRKRIGQRALDVVWGPLLRGKFGRPRRRGVDGVAVGQDLTSAPPRATRGLARPRAPGLSHGQLRRDLRGAGARHPRRRRRALLPRDGEARSR